MKRAETELVWDDKIGSMIVLPSARRMARRAWWTAASLWAVSLSLITWQIMNVPASRHRYELAAIIVVCLFPITIPALYGIGVAITFPVWWAIGFTRHQVDTPAFPVGVWAGGLVPIWAAVLCHQQVHEFLSALTGRP